MKNYHVRFVVTIDRSQSKQSIDGFMAICYVGKTKIDSAKQIFVDWHGVKPRIRVDNNQQRTNP